MRILHRSRTPRMRRLVAVGLALTLAAGCAGTDDAAPGAVTINPQAARAAGQLTMTMLPEDPMVGPYAGRELDPAVHPPTFTLTATDGEPFTFGRDATAPVTLLYFGYTSCPDVCPGHMAAIGAALDELSPERAQHVQVLFVTVDPATDTTKQLRRYLDHFDEDMIGLTGSARDINAAMASMGLPPSAIADPADGPPTHPSYVLAYVEGEARVAYPFGTSSRAFAHDLDLLTTRKGWST